MIERMAQVAVDPPIVTDGIDFVADVSNGVLTIAAGDGYTAGGYVGAWNGPPGAWMFHNGGENAAANRASIAKAEQLLRENLSRKQLKEYEERGYFSVIGGDTGREYRVTRGFSYNVLYADEIHRGVVQWKPMCFVPDKNLAMGDVLLSQKITLELDEQTALRVANY
jgi:hypothetical protein